MINTCNDREDVGAGAMDDFFVRAVYSRYRQSLKNAAHRAENLAVVKGVAAHCLVESHPFWFKRLATDFDGRSSSEFLETPLEGDMRQVVVNMLDIALASGDHHLVDMAAEDLFGLTPDGGHTLGQLRNSDGEMVAALQKRYAFNHVDTFNLAEGCVPIDIYFRRDNGILYVADYNNGCVRRLNVTGDACGMVSERFAKVRGMFEGADGELWIIDAGRGAIVALDGDDVVLREIDVRGLLPAGEKDVVIRTGCVFRGAMYLILADQETGVRSLVYLDPSNPVQLTGLTLQGSLLPLRMFGFESKLYFFDWPGTMVMEWDGRSASPGPRGYRHKLVKGMERFGHHHYIVAGDSVIKVAADGRVAFKYAIQDVVGLQGVTPLAMTSIDMGQSCRLLVSDGISGRIFVFEVE